MISLVAARSAINTAESEIVKNLAIWEPLSFFRLFSKIKIEKNDVEKRLFWNSENWNIMLARNIMPLSLCK